MSIEAEEAPAKRQRLAAGMVAGKVAVVTGAGVGIGRAIAIRLAEEGAKVLVADINETTGKETVARIVGKGGTAVFQHLDVTDEVSIEACMKAAKDAFGTIHILVNNAVQFIFGHLIGKAGEGSKTGTDREISDEDWRRSMDTGPIGSAKCIKHAVAIMKLNDLTGPVYETDEGFGITRIDAQSRGSIVNILSVSAYIAQPEFIPYNVSKGAGLQLLRCAALDLAPLKIRLNAVSPGTVETPGSYNHMRLTGASLEEGRKNFGKTNPMGRQAAPEEIAHAAVFLASDQASFMTGSNMIVDGGQTI